MTKTKEAVARLVELGVIAKRRTHQWIEGLRRRQLRFAIRILRHPGLWYADLPSPFPPSPRGWKAFHDSRLRRAPVELTA